MKLCLAAAETVAMAVEAETIPINHYLRQPQRLVHAIADSSLMECLGGDRYRLKMHPLNLLDIYHFQPTVVLRVWSDGKGNVYLNSESCEIRGIDYINDRFSLRVRGILSPIIRDGMTYLEGQANVEVSVELPPLLLFTPLSLLETTGKGLMRGVLSRIKQRLLSHLIADYHHWARGEEIPSDAALGVNYGLLIDP
ncbi:DUF1997 domain-containing protein [Spirulina subsalsa]|uniref:DUF1997 domain-containing protein n=1 Tax=Spirulina subsalsa TaxID=54311 RepID=UPI0003006B54|nr:DUF1997 domain-containing protein [Spirulina subsalsa]